MLKDIFFIAADARSGSTFLERELTDNFNISVIPETNFIINILKKYTKNTVKNDIDLKQIIDITFDKKFSDMNIKKEEIEESLINILPISIKEYIVKVLELYLKNKELENTIIGISKHYTFEYEKIKKLFPNSKYICIIRDPRAVFNSKNNSMYSQTKQPMEKNPIVAAIDWNLKTKKIEELKIKYNTSTYVIKYEDLIMDFEKNLETMKNFLGAIKSNINKFKVPERYGEIHENVGKEPLLEKINQWIKKMSNSDIYIIENITKKNLIRYNYKPINNKMSLEIIILIVKYIFDILNRKIKF